MCRLSINVSGNKLIIISCKTGIFYADKGIIGALPSVASQHSGTVDGNLQYGGGGGVGVLGVLGKFMLGGYFR